jgi:hypothetical protein
VRLSSFVAAHEERLTAGMTAKEKVLLLGLLQRVDLNLRRQKVGAKVASRCKSALSLSP